MPEGSDFTGGAYLTCRYEHLDPFSTVPITIKARVIYSTSSQI
jgi:hypothetical protein